VDGLVVLAHRELGQIAGERAGHLSGGERNGENEQAGSDDYGETWIRGAPLADG
jgi:hypothetical protein